MGANKFATLLYKNNTPKIAIVLIYTLLEWTLIALLLLNGLFSYLITRFANFFGLQPPCIFCSRVDHVFGPRKSYRDLMCDAHAVEISKLGFCSNHRNLAEASEMCEDCSSSRPLEMTAFSWMKRCENGEKDLRCSCCDVILESGFYSPYNFVVNASAFGVLEGTQREEYGTDDVNLVKEHEDREFEEEGDASVGDNCNACVKVVDDESFEDREVEGGGHFVGENCDVCVKVVNDKSSEDREAKGDILVVENCDACVKMVDDESLELLTPMRAENGLLGVEERLVPIELIDSSTLTLNKFNSDVPTQVDFEDEDDEDDDRDYFGYNLVEKDDTYLHVGTILEEERLVSVELIESSNFINNNLNSIDEDDDGDYVGYKLVVKVDPASDIETVSEEEKETMLSTKEINSSQSLPLVNIVEDECSLQSSLILEEGLDAQVEEEHVEGFGEFQASEEENKVIDAEAICEISIGSEICKHEQIDVPQFNDLPIPQSACANEQCCSESYNVIIDKEQDTHFLNSACADEQCSEIYIVINDKEHVTEDEQVEPMDDDISRNVNELSIHTELYDIEEERVPETPTSIDNLHALHKRFLYERREYGTESLDGSVASEIDGNEVLTVDHLKAALKGERRTLSALYTELEEERSASAIAANQTMAMITRLQEEKAAMQMEALQYQRMMDEQSEYDQEALQLLNELMMKREKEKQELEKELEDYRKKVYYYEARERRKTTERMKTNGNGSGTSSSSSAGDCDDLLFESREGEDCNYSHNESNQNTPSRDVLNSLANQEEDSTHLLALDESLADFEEERISILDQLKALEEKLFSTGDDELKTMGHHHFSDENGHRSNGVYESYNGFEHDMDTNEKLHHKPRNVASEGKRLLPLFEATNDVESEHELSPTLETMNCSPHSLSKSAIDDHKKLAIAEEMDNVYERLQALEADREFLKHCIRSLKKGDKGMDLLQEILQHLRDLRNAELHVKNEGDAFASLSA